MRKQIKKLNYTIHNFETSERLKLCGLLNKSTSKLNEKIILIHIHGMCGDLFSGVGDFLTETSNKNKLSSFLINTRGHGIVTSFKQKDKDGNRSYHTGGTAYENFENSVLDIDSAINYLKTLGYKKFILSGHSTGCQKITYYQLKNIKNKSIKALIMLAPGDDLNVEKKNLGDKFQLVLKKAKEKMKSNVLFTTEDFGLLSAKRFYNLFKKTSIEGNLFNYTKNLEYLQTIKVPILSLIGKQDPYFLDTQKAVNNISSNLSNKKSKSLLVSGNHSYYSFENDLKKEIELFLKTIL